MQKILHNNIWRKSHYLLFLKKRCIVGKNQYISRECKIVCVNLKEELKKGKPSPYDWTAKTNQNTEAFPMEDSIKSQSQAVYQADGANTFAGLDKVYGLM